ncbi:hypothetical protein TWF788_011241 [Orbilia oligospora]|uniref:BTB domain-containing protein n=1 Tax=Orbilia oligospora TaxID=2813651 RepID=A0A7C8U578_ORBOL|nr:hypothetical protein TWF788_011241 [Orbilia oligospora]
MKSTKDTKFFKNLFNDPEFSDIIATVHNQTDNTQVQYYMHQMMVCNSSAHFKQLCSSAPVDENGCKLLSFNTTPGAFELIGRWVYKNTDFPQCNDIKVIKEALVYADSAGVEDFRLALLKHFLRSKAGLYYSVSGQYESHSGSWRLFKDISELGLPRDRDTLSRFVRYYIPGVTPSSAWLQELSTESKNGLMAAILLDGKGSGNFFGGNFGAFPYGVYGNDEVETKDEDNDINFSAPSFFINRPVDSRPKNAMRHRSSGC